MTTPYQPIDCGAYDELEILAMRRIECTIEYGCKPQEHKANGDETAPIESVRSRILDVNARDGEEFIHLENGLTLRLDRLVRVNGKTIDRSCPIDETSKNTP